MTGVQTCALPISYFGFLTDYGTMLNSLDLDFSGRLGMNNDDHLHWELNIRASYDAGPFKVTMGLALDDDEYSSSRTLSCTVSELGL